MPRAWQYLRIDDLSCPSPQPPSERYAKVSAAVWAAAKAPTAAAALFSSANFRSSPDRPGPSQPQLRHGTVLASGSAPGTVLAQPARACIYCTQAEMQDRRSRNGRIAVIDTSLPFRRLTVLAGSAKCRYKA